ncbi:Copper amine oxidase N-terminal domain-containing protein [Abditibacterium utsteinense]|uniref:Copper amine oxidase N-terminal domain-containing protein n=1 Tax=Abditibacterium utsteinense TaxID=1960156 RepID=A0A2S8STN3_9BACT|nr:copper amine oxidase N-terminal domain-containing protein [Abditibacterium utsteinense]PQV64157.1 Copper amine oxidase N-terminal domain-containing protein [Abditibacterium utsteinense]
MKSQPKILAASALSLALAAGAARADIAVNLNGQPLATGAAPMQIGGRTLVPMRDIFEALGAQLSWNPVAQTITAQKDLTKIQLAINNPDALVNGRSIRLEQPATLINGRTFVPLRFVAEATGAQVDWNGPLQLISIRSNLSHQGPVIAQNPGNSNFPGGLQAGGLQPGASDETDLDELGANNSSETRLERRRRRQERRQSQSDGSQVAAARAISIPSGAVVPVQLDQNLSSATARVGQTFTATILSRRLGDSEFPAGTKVSGRVIEARPSENGQPGVLDLDWTTAVLPDGTRVPLRGELTSLDTSNVQMTGGRIVAPGAKSDNKLKVIGVGAGAGFVLGRVLKTNSTVTTILGAAGGYLFGKARDRKAQEATLTAQTTLGVRLADAVRYADTDDYFGPRSNFLRASVVGNDDFNPSDYGYDTSTSVPRNDVNAPGRYGDYGYANELPLPAPGDNDAPIGVGDIYPEDTNTNSNDLDNGQQVAGYQQISIPSGAVVPVTIDQEISSATARVGQTFTATVVSQRLGDSEFPAGTKVSGRVIEARAQQGTDPGVLDLEFRDAVLPNGTRVALRGDLVGLDDASVQTQNGRIVARAGANKKNDKLKVIGIGTAAGFVLGRVLKKDGLLPSLLGALGGYLYSGKNGNDKPGQAVVAQGARLGIRLGEDVRYGSPDYYTYRAQYLRQ